MEDLIQQQIENIQQQVQVAEAGYEAFRRMYAQTNQRPKPKPYKSRLGLIRSALIVILGASSIVSASHTIPTFADGPEGRGVMAIGISLFVGIAAFCMSELALATFAYVGVMRHYRETGQEPQSLKTLVKMGVVIPFIVMGAANINHEFQINGIELPQPITSSIILAISLSAPMMGYISGEVFAVFEVIDRVDQAKWDAEQQDILDKWEEKCRAAWGREKVNYGGRIKVEAVPNSIPTLSNGKIGMENVEIVQVLPAQSSIGHTKKPMASQKARDYFEAHENELIASDVSGALAAGVAGSSTVYAVMATMRKERGI